MNVYDWYSYKDYEKSYYSDWTYLGYKSKQMSQVTKYAIPGFIELNPLCKGYNDFTEYCDQHLTELGEAIKNGFWNSENNYGTYFYMGGVLFDRQGDSGEVIFRMPGCTCGSLTIVNRHIINCTFNDECIYGCRGVKPVYNESILTDIHKWFNKYYDIDYVSMGDVILYDLRQVTNAET